MLPKYLQIREMVPEKQSLIFSFDDDKMPVEYLIKNMDCKECEELNAVKFYDTMNNVFSKKKRVL